MIINTYESEKKLEAITSEKYYDMIKKIKYNAIHNVRLNDVGNYILQVLQGIDEHKHRASSYTIENFRQEYHGRFYSNGGGILDNLKDAREAELLKLYNYFRKLDTAKSDDWKTITINYLYYKLTNAVKEDLGLGVGNHPFELNPPVTMYVEESISAEEMVSAMEYRADNRQRFITEDYIDALEKNGIDLPEKKYIDIKADKCDGCKRKLYLIAKSNLRSLPANNIKEFILNCYIGGLFKNAEYRILESFFNDDSFRKAVCTEDAYMNDTYCYDACLYVVCHLPF